MNKTKIYFIECRTGCSCCANENHYRGPYYIKRDAERRISFFETGPWWPISSQYANRGIYDIVEISCEDLGDGRFIIGDRVYDGCEIVFMEINKDGSLTCGNQDRDYFSSELY